MQTNIRDYRDFAPRIGVRVGSGQRQERARPKTVIRGGVRHVLRPLRSTYILQAQRLNGVTETELYRHQPGYFSGHSRRSSPLQLQRLVDHAGGPNLRAPYIIQTAIGVERQLPRNTTMAVNYTNSRGLHLLRTRDINAPLPGTYTVPGTGVRPYPSNSEIFNYESTGILNQNQMFVNVRNQAHAATFRCSAATS